MKYYLDTNIIIYALNNRFPSIQKHFCDVASSTIVIPDIVLAEIEYGARKSKDYDRTINIYKQFTDNFNTCHFDKKAIREYGIIRNELEKSGSIIGFNDLIIASIVKADNGILVTHNTNEFSRVKGLMLEDWCDE